MEQKTGQRRKKRTKQLKKELRHTQRRVSRTDPEFGYLNRPEKPHGIILDVAVTPGNASDATPHLDQLARVGGIVPIQAATADGYL
ncbi:MAG: hypothetical protein RR135_02905 [Oscillospiraceae bacterium]